MSHFMAAAIGFGFGILLVILVLSDAIQGGTLGQCRAAHPGYDCDLGWVVSEPFK